MANTRKILIQKPGLNIEQIDLSSVNILAKEVVLEETPLDPLKVSVDAVSGTAQKNGTDFTVTGNVLSWDGRGLETVLEENDTIIITYQT